jgi:hypothetical protein
MRRVAWSLLVIAFFVPSHGLSVLRQVAEDCPCKPDDGDLCRITRCSDIGSGTGTGSSGTFETIRPDQLREPQDLSRPRDNTSRRNETGQPRSDNK